MATTRAPQPGGSPISTSHSAPSRTSSSNKTANKSPKVICPVCCDPIEDAVGKNKGQDSIFCDGPCQEWIHRQCAGLSKSLFKSISSTSDPFCCPRCMIDKQSNDICELKRNVAHLMEVVSKISPSVSDLSPSASGPSPTTVLGSSPTPHPPLPAHSPSPAVAVPTESVREKKFNIIAYGIEESSKGTKRSIRKQEDIKKVEVIISYVSPNVSSNNIHDCTRLGKYNSTNPRPRLILINFTCVSDVHEVLSQVKHLKKPVVFKPDCPYKEQKIDSILLKER